MIALRGIPRIHARTHARMHARIYAMIHASIYYIYIYIYVEPLDWSLVQEPLSRALPTGAAMWEPPPAGALGAPSGASAHGASRQKLRCSSCDGEVSFIGAPPS